MECPHPRRAFERITDHEDAPEWEREWARRCLDRFDLREKPSTYELPYETQLVALDEDTVFTAYPGEPTGELLRSILDETSLTEDTFVLGYTNGLNSYLPSAELIERKTYEGDLSQKMYGLPGPYHTDCEDVLIRTTRANVRAWRNDEKPDGYGRFHLVEDESSQPAFFCLSTGRCGTKTLAKVLDTAPNARVYHHPRPFLIEKTLEAYRGTIDREQVFRQARSTAIRDAWRDGQVFGEVDHNMTPFAPAISKLLPKSKFVVLVRNPWGFVRSGMRRGYYRGHPWDVGRLRPEPSHPDAEDWPTWTAFEKTCWLWSDTYLRIANYVKEIPDDRVRLILFEDLIDGAEATRDLFEFLGLDGFCADRIEEVLSQKLNSQKTGEFPPPEEWSEELHNVLWTRCCTTIERWELTDYVRMAERRLQIPSSS